MDMRKADLEHAVLKSTEGAVLITPQDAGKILGITSNTAARKIKEAGVINRGTQRHPRWFVPEIVDALWDGRL